MCDMMFSRINGMSKLAKMYLYCTKQGCQRVSYCSKSCRKSDSEHVAQNSNEVEEDVSAFGHSAVICSLLKTCNDDDNAEDDSYNKNNTKSAGKMTGNVKVDPTKEAALYRVQTELESYPATLFNILADSPNWFTEAMTRRVRYLEDCRSPEKIRRGKRDRTAISSTTATQPSSATNAGNNKQLVIHIVGASSNSELWGWDGTNDNESVLEAYAEASTNLSSYFESFPITLKSIRLIFIGPDCHKRHSKCNVAISESKTVLMLETHCCDYGRHDRESVPAPDVIVFFNPGFSCPDYDWSAALDEAISLSHVGAIPFLVTTNTEMEGFADIKYLLDGNYIDSKSIPGDILEAVDFPSIKRDCDIDDANKSFFFDMNPYHGLRVRQSGTMANDVYVKSRWMIGGLFEKDSNSKNQQAKEGAKEDVHEQPKKKHRSDKKGNSKKSNPALI